MQLKSGAENMSNSVVNYLTTNMDRNSTTLTISRRQNFQHSTVESERGTTEELEIKTENTKEPTKYTEMVKMYA